MAEVVPADFIHELQGKISSSSSGYFDMSKKTGKMYYRGREEGYQKNNRNGRNGTRLRLPMRIKSSMPLRLMRN